MQKRLFAILTLLLVFSLVLAGCSPKERGRWNQDTSYEVGALPDDVCMVNGQPLIINANTESDGGFSLVYVRNNGDIVIKAWLTDPITHLSLKPAGEYYWTGGNCPSQ